MRDALREKNITFFEEKFPEIAKSIKEIEAPLSTLEENEEGTVVNIGLGEKGKLYTEDAPSFSERQTQSYFSRPRCIFFRSPTGSGGLVGMFGRINTEVERILEKAEVVPSQIPLFRSGVMVVFGVGLGYHLEHLASATKNQAFVVIEPVLEFLSHSLSVVDWEEIWKILDEKECRLEIFLDSNPTLLMKRLANLFLQENPLSPDGTHLYIHYPSWIFNRVSEQFSSESYSFFLARGFFEDELRMLSQTTRNFLNHDFYLIEREGRLERSEPFFIVGSGPSLDKDIEYVRKWKDHVMIFSAGTALRALLSNGIRPDFHCELENSQSTADILTKMDQEFGLQGIKLIASCTIRPEAAALFEEKYFFFRDSVSSTKIYAKDDRYKYIKGAAPTCTNTAFIIAHTLGFHKGYLLGVDCGVRDPERHHSQASVYYKDKTYANANKDFPIVLPGNFGGKVFTNWVFDFTRQMMVEVAEYVSKEMYNCSDGALIKGIKPKVAKSLRFSQKIDKEKAFSAIRAGSKFFKRGEFFQVSGKKFETYLEAFDDASREIDEWLDGLPDTFTDVNELYLEAQRFTRENGEAHCAVSQLMAASIGNMLGIVRFYVVRIEDEKKREEVCLEVLKSYAHLVREMIKEGRALWVDLTEEAKAANL